MKLAQLQESLQAHVLHGDEEIHAQIIGDARFSTPLRLGVYSHAYAARLVEVLAQTYPAVQAALGAERFAVLVSEFTRQYPSTFRSAGDYGEVLGEWLRMRLTGPRAAGIADLARFEWAIAEAFDAPDCVPLQAESVAVYGPAQWPDLKFEFTSSLRRVRVDSNCVSWWKFATAATARPSRWRSTCAQQWLIWRQELAVFYRRVPLAETQALDAALGGQSFGALCEGLEDPVEAATLLRGWFSAGLIISARADPQD